MIVKDQELRTFVNLGLESIPNYSKSLALFTLVLAGQPTSILGDGDANFVLNLLVQRRSVSHRKQYLEKHEKDGEYDRLKERVKERWLATLKLVVSGAD